jgi:signal transduction histidine kinase/ActR/RegA family two-component response regulator
VRLADLVDLSVVQRLTDANYHANRMPIGIIDSDDGLIMVGVGWQDICVQFHRVHPQTSMRCRESNRYINDRIQDNSPCEYTCKNGLRDIGIPIVVDGKHLATLFLGQFFYEGEAPDREYFTRQAREFGFDEERYLAALDRVPVFTREAVANILRYDQALAAFISDLAERSLVHRRDETALREADRRKDEFLAVLSHELRNPLAPISNSVAILARARVGESADRALAVIDRQVGHLTRLVEDLLDINRISRGRLQVRCAHVELGGVVKRVLEDHRSVLAARKLDTVLELPQRQTWVNADETRLVQMIGNLLQNAVKFTPPGGQIVVGVQNPDRDRARVFVRDNGPGIDPEMRQRLFEPFAQADVTLARSSGGLGLGLALVKGLVELQGGSVEAASNGTGKGAEFAFTLPLIPQVTAVPAVPTHDSPAGPRRRVLVIEDNADSAETLKDLLEIMGHEVTLAFDGVTGLEAVRQVHPEVVFCDIGLPGMSGWEVAQTLRTDRNRRHMRLVALTGYAAPEDERRAQETGFDRFLAKPADFEELEAVLLEPPLERDDCCQTTDP